MNLNYCDCLRCEYKKLKERCFGEQEGQAVYIFYSYIYFACP